ncbi:MAG TPA: TatD family hydrolase [Longimicrobiales bacterium]|nr:TatD family hydrolase [Longimicrobiales bacterium]
MPLFDSHCHLTDEKLWPEVGRIIARARRAGVGAMVSIASDLEDAERAIDLARAHEGVWCTAGVHPHRAERWSPDALARLRELAEDEWVVALGETGLDYHYDNAPRQRQRDAFAAQLALAGELGLPVVVHSRDADADTAAMLADHPAARGVLHCFAAGEALLERGLELGWLASFSGLVTFPRFEGRALVARVPADRLLVETDSPYLAPVPHRGRTNEPAFVAHVAAEVAALRGVAAQEIATLTWENAHRFYQLES